MSLDEPLSVKVERWRQAAAAGTLSLDEYKQAIKEIRQGRITAAESSAKRSPKAAKAAVNVSALEDEIDNIPD